MNLRSSAQPLALACPVLKNMRSFQIWKRGENKGNMGAVNKSDYSQKNIDHVSLISHKLRTPLTVIISTVNNLLDGAFGKLNQEQISWLKKLTLHTNNLETLLNDILEVVRTQTDKMEVIQDRFAADGVKVHPEVKLRPKAMGGEAKPPRSAKAPFILIVDDEADVRDVVREGLEIKGFKTCSAANGTEARKAALEIQPEVIIMDVLLGRENGIEICHDIKKSLPRFTPVILVTGQDDLREKIAGTNHSADDLLTKPFQMEELYTRVNSMMRLKKLNDELEDLKSKGEDRS